MRRIQQRRTLTIANGASLSGELDLTEFTITGIIMPAAWTAADLTLAASDAAGGTFVPVYDAAGTELTIQADTSRFIALSPDATRALRFAKLRSGTSGSAVNQGAARELVVIVEALGE